MFSIFDYDLFPYVIVIFYGTIKNQIEFDLFLNNWEKLYLEKKDFKFIFDTTKLNFVNPLYCIQMSNFIKKLKSYPIQYLKESLIIINSKFIERLLKIIFFLQSPVAPVYLISDSLIEIKHKIRNKISINNLNILVRFNP
jgi:hypothetical protein